MPVKNSKSTSQTPIVEKSKKLIGLEEFSQNKHLRLEEIAGFRAYTKSKKYRSRLDWESALVEYKTRDLNS